MENLTFLVIVFSFLLNAIYHMVNITTNPYVDQQHQLRWKFSWFHTVIFLLTVGGFLCYGWETTWCHSYANNFFFNY